jgi:hypothetical protein
VGGGGGGPAQQGENGRVRRREQGGRVRGCTGTEWQLHEVHRRRGRGDEAGGTAGLGSQVWCMQLAVDLNICPCQTPIAAGLVFKTHPCLGSWSLQLLVCMFEGGPPAVGGVVDEHICLGVLMGRLSDAADTANSTTEQHSTECQAGAGQQTQLACGMRCMQEVYATRGNEAATLCMCKH